MKDSLVRALILIPMVFGACAPASRHDPAASAPVDVETTYEPPRPTIVKEKGYQIARGATRLKDVKAQFDSQTKSMRLSGAIEYLPVKGGGYQKIDVNLVGMLDEDGFIVLRPEAVQAQNDSLTLAAKATCLSEAGSCSSSFIDIYLYTDGVVYHHQIESQQKTEEKTEKPDDKQNPTPIPTPAEAPEDKSTSGEDSEDEEWEGGADQVDEEQGQYVGTVHEDIETILKVKPVPEDEPAMSKEERDARAEKDLREKREKEKQEEVKKAGAETGETKNGETQKEVPKKETPKKDDTNKNAPKKDEPKKEEPKPEDPKKEDPKKDVPIPKPKPKTPAPDKEKDREAEAALAKPKIAKSSQAIGAVNSGRLENPVNMKDWEDKKGPVNFHIIRPERKTHFATNELAYLVDLIGKATNQIIPGYKLAIGDLSKEKGGHFGKHLSHTNGLDADIAFYFDNKSFQGYFASALSVKKPHHNWMADEQWKLYKIIVRTQLVDRIFIHETLKKEICKIAIKNGEVNKDTKSGPVYETLRRLIADQDHVTHFHMRVKCSSAQLRCRQMAEPAPGTGCF